MSILSYKVTADDIGTVYLNEADPVRSVLQNVAMILATAQGSCPMYRGFGLPQKFLDKPIPIAIPMMYAEVRDAIDEYEPRAEVIDVTFAIDATTPGRLIPTVEVNVIDE